MEPKKVQPTTKEENENSHSKDKEPSLASRIASSASGLTRGVVGSSSANSFASSLPSGSGLSSKLQNASSSSSTTWSENLPSRPLPSGLNGQSTHGSVHAGGESFRSSVTHLKHSQDMDAFQDSHVQLPTLMEYADAGSSSSWATQFHRQPPGSSSNLPSSLGVHYQGRNGVTENDYGHPVDYDDGAEVRMLLSDPSFMADTVPSDMMMEDTTEQTPADLFGENFSAEEQQIAEKIKATLPPPATHSVIWPDNPLNLRPEFAALAASNPHLAQELIELASTIGDGAQSYVDPVMQQHLLNEWQDVLNSYTDEVWGDFLPVVKAAREQLAEVKAGTERLDTKAVARLKLILGHVVQGSTSNTAYAQTSMGNQSQASMSEQQNRQSFREKSLYTYNAQSLEVNQELYQLATNVHVNGQGANGEYARQNGSAMHEAARPSQTNRTTQHIPQEPKDTELPTFYCPWVSCHEVTTNPPLSVP